jgi:hypothetical protein
MQALQIVLVVGILAFIIGSFAWKKWRDKQGGPTVDDTALTTDLTAMAKQGKLDPIVGMEDVIERVIHVVARKNKNNPLLNGKLGVGKDDDIFKLKNSSEHARRRSFSDPGRSDVESRGRITLMRGLA